jgi:single-strand DNA-binding protein
MASFNKAILMGNLTRDPELRATPSGAPVCNFDLAMNRVYTTQAGERREEVCYMTIVVWGKQAEHCAQYLKKGRAARHAASRVGSRSQSVRLENIASHQR